MISVFYELVLDIFEHHVEPVFYIILSSSRHFFDDFGPLVADGQSLLKNEDVLIQAERIFFDFGIQEINPSLTALLPVSIDV